MLGNQSKYKWPLVIVTLSYTHDLTSTSASCSDCSGVQRWESSSVWTFPLFIPHTTTSACFLCVLSFCLCIWSDNALYLQLLWRGVTYLQYLLAGRHFLQQSSPASLQSNFHTIIPEGWPLCCWLFMLAAEQLHRDVLGLRVLLRSKLSVTPAVTVKRSDFFFLCL